jgi:hypothetical protein
MIGPALDALDAWVDQRESGGTSGALPPDPIVTPKGTYPRLTERRRKGDAREARRIDSIVSAAPAFPHDGWLWSDGPRATLGAVRASWSASA